MSDLVRCTKCGEEKLAEYFPKGKNKSNGLGSWCKACSAKNIINSQRKKASGITEDEYNRLHKEQGGMCKICGIHEDYLKRSLHVDHCHKTGKIRGLLCGRCNVGVGYFKDNPDRLRKAADYLEGKI